ncbi:hypothetical protein ebA529 [Aromatoleum aromaticum EbN1]|uniref:Uncharacterized protein n=1 Tax=Aromatoleum aromaticum (strain DSM 19018 / LMG 30748 / EbN1) TaxID=76114 RepID=Q5P8G6_AROAE|nr:hypothetical protein [Aromatoleum aromaticum]CAI06393.1 hypothetical protein ebA529 [Aromatoleum aromaticum EbN1]
MKHDYSGLRAARRIAHGKIRPATDPGNATMPADRVRIEDIAHVLATTWCFAGQTKTFYSLAQHDYLASVMVPAQDALPALLLDIEEALRQLLASRETNGRTTAAIRVKFGVSGALPSSVRDADLILRATEQRDLERPRDSLCPALFQVRPLSLKLQPLPPIVAKHLFIDRYYELRPQADPRRRHPEEGVT